MIDVPDVIVMVAVVPRVCVRAHFCLFFLFFLERFWVLAEIGREGEVCEMGVWGCVVKVVRIHASICMG